MTRRVRPAAVLAVAALAGIWAAQQAEAGGAGEEGVTVTRQFDIEGFDGVEVGNAFTAEVQRGAGYAVSVEIDRAFEPRLRVRKAGSRLQVSLEPSFSLRFGGPRPRVRITMPALSEMELSGAVNASISGFRSGAGLLLELSGASSVEGDIESGDVRVEASGASSVVLRGRAAGARVDASGASKVDLGDFPTQATAVHLSGASNAVVRPAGKLDVDASGASRLVYIGSPPMGRIELSGSSTISPR